MSEENIAVVRLFIAAINIGPVDRVYEIFAPHHVIHLLDPGEDQGPRGEAQLLSMLRRAFPDAHIAVENIGAAGDQVEVQYTIDGTHKGELWGILPTGERVAFGGTDEFRIFDGEIVEHRGSNYALRLLQQLGVLPAHLEALEGPLPEEMTAWKEQDQRSPGSRLRQSVQLRPRSAGLALRDELL